MATGMATIKSGTKMTTEKTSLFRRISIHSLDMIVRMCFIKPLTPTLSPLRRGEGVCQSVALF